MSSGLPATLGKTPIIWARRYDDAAPFMLQLRAKKTAKRALTMFPALACKKMIVGRLLAVVLGSSLRVAPFSISFSLGACCSITKALRVSPSGVFRCSSVNGIPNSDGERTSVREPCGKDDG